MLENINKMVLEINEQLQLPDFEAMAQQLSEVKKCRECPLITHHIYTADLNYEIVFYCKSCNSSVPGFVFFLNHAPVESKMKNNPKNYVLNGVSVMYSNNRGDDNLTKLCFCGFSSL